MLWSQSRDYLYALLQSADPGTQEPEVERMFPRVQGLSENILNSRSVLANV